MSRYSPEQLDTYRNALVHHAGGYLRNPLRVPGLTCETCTTPSEGRRYCDPCRAHKYTRGIADIVCALTYAVGGTQAGYLMRQYKGSFQIRQHEAVLAALMVLGGSLHTGCVERILGAPVTHWSWIPSLPAKPGTHAFRKFAAQAAQGIEVPLAAAASAPRPRALNAAHFQATATLPDGSHVLLMDDTWTGGGHAQSAALALRRAGATRISIMVAARWIKPDYGDNTVFLRDHVTEDFDPTRCPWTDGVCPAPVPLPVW